MGRYYYIHSSTMDLDGKFWFGVQCSTDLCAFDKTYMRSWHFSECNEVIDEDHPDYKTIEEGSVCRWCNANNESEESDDETELCRAYEHSITFHFNRNDIPTIKRVLDELSQELDKHTNWNIMVDSADADYIDEESWNAVKHLSVDLQKLAARWCIGTKVLWCLGEDAETCYVNCDI